MKFDYTFDSAVKTSQLNGSYPSSIMFQCVVKTYKEVERERIRMRKKNGSAHSESIASDDARGNACLKKVNIKLIV